VSVRAQGADRLHVLEVPLSGLSLLLPSASIAEVASYAEATTVPFAPRWLLGVVGWRTAAVPVVSFEALLGGAPVAPAPAAKIVILYPLPGRREWEFVALLSAAEPRPRAVEGAGLVAAEPADLPASPYLAAGLKAQGGRLLAVPDFEALKATFYP
jgi:chemosensory pili system protein ChpC